MCVQSFLLNVCSAGGWNFTVDDAEVLGLVVVFAPAEQSLSGLLTAGENRGQRSPKKLTPL